MKAPAKQLPGCAPRNVNSAIYWNWLAMLARIQGGGSALFVLRNAASRAPGGCLLKRSGLAICGTRQAMPGPALTNDASLISTCL